MNLRRGVVMAGVGLLTLPWPARAQQAERVARIGWIGSIDSFKELLPSARKVAVFTTAGTVGQLEVTQEAARRLGLALQVIDFKREPFDFGAAFADAVRGKSDGLMVLG